MPGVRQTGVGHPSCLYSLLDNVRAGIRPDITLRRLLISVRRHHRFLPCCTSMPEIQWWWRGAKRNGVGGDQSLVGLYVLVKE